ncbi:MAG: PEGA domain-containing protein [Methanoregula sp.]
MIKIVLVAILIFGIITAGCSSPALQKAAAAPKPTQTSFYQFGNGTFNVNGTLQQVNGTLHINSMPPGADVYMDGKYLIRTNCALSYTIPPGRHTLEFRMDGYETVGYPITVEKGGMEGINITLEKKAGSLPVASATMAGTS